MTSTTLAAAYADLYLRISEADDEDALDRHEADCRALAKQLGVPVRRALREIVSATKAVRRDKFEELLADPAPMIICWHQDRLIRTIKDLEKIIALGISVHSVQASPLDLATPTGRAVARTVTSWSQFEGEHREARQASALAQARAKGVRTGGRRPFGWIIDHEAGGLREHPVEGPAVREAYEMLLGGRKLTEISAYWNSLGLVTPQAGQPWRPEWIARTLRLPTHAAQRTHHGAVIGEAAWRPLVERTTWEAACAILNDPARRQNKKPMRSSLLAAVAVCGRCGAVMHAGRNDRRGEVYACSSGRDVSVKRSPVDQHVLQEIAAQIEVFEALEAGRITGTDDDGAAVFGGVDLREPVTVDPRLGTELQALEKQLDDLADDLGLSTRVLERRAAAIEARIEELKEQIADQVANAPVRSSLADWIDKGEHATYAEAFAAADTATQRRVLVEFLDRTGQQIVLYPPGRGSRSFRPETVRLRSKTPH